MRRIIFIVGLLFTMTTAMGQKGNSYKDSYNYKRAMEAWENSEDISTIQEYLTKELAEHPKNGYAYLLAGVVYVENEKYGTSLEALGKSIQLLKKDKDMLCEAYMVRSNVYKALDEVEKALADLNLAVKLKPKDSEVLHTRGELLYELERYDESDRDYNAIIRLEPGNTLGYMGIGRNNIARGQYEEALKSFDYSVKLEPDFGAAYAFRGEAHLRLGHYSEASDDIIAAIDKSHSQKALVMMQEFKEPEVNILLAKLKVQMTKNRNDDYWPYCIGVIYEGLRKYPEAIEAYKTSFKAEADPSVAYRISECYYQMGAISQSIDHLNQALELDSTDILYRAQLAHLNYSNGDSRTAISQFDKLIEEYPEEGTLYYQRGFVKDMTGDIEGAIDDYTMCTVLQPDYSVAFHERADLYAQRGDSELAAADYRKAIELDSTGVSIGSAYCYLGLGETEKVRPCIDSLLAQSDIDGGDIYNIACLYSLMNQPDSALHYLGRALEEGYLQFYHIRLDPDLRNIRGTEAFDRLLAPYEEKVRTLFAPHPDTAGSAPEERVSEIPFTKDGGVYKVKCQVNSLPLHFVFDTGASSVSLSMVEATFMLKNGYLSKDDVVGSQYFLDANGNVSEGTVVNLRNVHFGDCDLSDVKASVVRNQKAPLLLGQTVLSRIGKIEIDNEHRVLRITYRQ